MARIAYEGFSVALPDGWCDVLEEATYSDPDQLPPITFAGPDRVGALHVARPLYDPEDQPGPTADDAGALVVEWGASRGLRAPVHFAQDADAHGGVATAVHLVGEELVQVWFFTNGNAVYRLRTPARGDCNGDGIASSADIESLLLELADGAPHSALEAPNGAHRGSWGCDADGDGMIQSEDIPALARIIGYRQRAVGR